MSADGFLWILLFLRSVKLLGFFDSLHYARDSRILIIVISCESLCLLSIGFIPSPLGKCYVFFSIKTLIIVNLGLFVLTVFD